MEAFVFAFMCGCNCNCSSRGFPRIIYRPIYTVSLQRLTEACRQQRLNILFVKGGMVVADKNIEMTASSSATAEK